MARPKSECDCIGQVVVDAIAVDEDVVFDAEIVMNVDLVSRSELGL
jgi:hypothetical protein